MTLLEEQATVLGVPLDRARELVSDVLLHRAMRDEPAMHAALDQLEELLLPEHARQRRMAEQQRPATEQPVQSASLAPMTDWIRCEERLAPKDRYVLVFSRSYGVIVAARVASRMPYWFVSAPDGATVADTTHWQPLPKPPRKAKR